MPEWRSATARGSRAGGSHEAWPSRRAHVVASASATSLPHIRSTTRASTTTPTRDPERACDLRRQPHRAVEGKVGRVAGDSSGHACFAMRTSVRLHPATCMPLADKRPAVAYAALWMTSSNNLRPRSPTRSPRRVWTLYAQYLITETSHRAIFSARARFVVATSSRCNVYPPLPPGMALTMGLP